MFKEFFFSYPAVYLSHKPELFDEKNVVGSFEKAKLKFSQSDLEDGMNCELLVNEGNTRADVLHLQGCFQYLIGDSTKAISTLTLKKNSNHSHSLVKRGLLELEGNNVTAFKETLICLNRSIRMTQPLHSIGLKCCNLIRFPQCHQ